MGVSTLANISRVPTVVPDEHRAITWKTSSAMTVALLLLKQGAFRDFVNRTALGKGASTAKKNED